MSALFSNAFFKDSLKRCRAFTLICAAISAVSVISSLGSFYMLLPQYMDGGIGMSPQYMTFADIGSFISVFVGILVPIMTVNAFSYLSKRNESDFYEALPISRRAKAVSGMLAVLASALFVILVSALACFIGVLPCVGKVMTFGFGISVAQFFGYILIAMLATAVAVIAVSITGTTKCAMVTAFAVLIAPRIVLSCINGAVTQLDPTLVSGHVIPLFDNNYNLLTADLIGNSAVFTKPLAYIYTIVLTAVYLLLSIYLFERRRSETATHGFSRGIARHVVRMLFASVFSAAGLWVAFLGDFFIILGIIVILISFAIYFIFEIVTGKGEKTFLSALKTFPIFIGVNIVMVATVLVSSALIGMYSPDSDRIKSVSVVGSEPMQYVTVSYDQYVYLRSEDIRLESAVCREAVAAALDRGSDVKVSEYNTLTVKINTGAGNAYRTLYFTAEEYNAILAELRSREEYRAEWLNVDEGALYPSVYVASRYVLSDELLSAVKRDVATLGFDAWYDICTSYETLESLTYTIVYNGSSYEVNIPITESMTETYDLYKEIYGQVMTEDMNAMKKRLEDALSGADDPIGVAIYYYPEDNWYELDIEVSSEDPSSEAFVSELLELLSTDIPYGDSINVELYENSFFGDYYDYYFGIAEGVTEEKLIKFFKKYGAVYDDYV